MLNDILLNVVMLNAVILSVSMLNDILLNVVMLNVVQPSLGTCFIKPFTAVINSIPQKASVFVKVSKK